MNAFGLVQPSASEPIRLWVIRGPLRALENKGLAAKKVSKTRRSMFPRIACQGRLNGDETFKF